MVYITSRWGKEVDNPASSVHGQHLSLFQSQQKYKIFSVMTFSIDRCVNEDLPDVDITLLSVTTSTVAQGLGDWRQ